MHTIKNIIYAYEDTQGRCPYELWLSSLKDPKALAAVLSRIDRMEIGVFGDVAPVGEGISELRIHYGPGYRVYFAQQGKTIYLLLCGGNKSTQKNDIKLAKAYWRRQKAGEKKWVEKIFEAFTMCIFAILKWPLNTSMRLLLRVIKPSFLWPLEILLRHKKGGLLLLQSVLILAVKVCTKCFRQQVTQNLIPYRQYATV
jgi:putative addiction module killer protein